MQPWVFAHVSVLFFFLLFSLSLKCGLFENFGIMLGKPCGTLS